MLIDFKVKNYRSIKDEQTFSMVKASGDEHEDTHAFTPLENSKSLSLLHSATIYGPNAAGKSNILRSLDTMQTIVTESATKIERGDTLPVTPFLLDTLSRNQPSEFEITFINKKIRYQYGFTVTKTMIIEEWLIAFPKGRPQHWFARAYSEDTKSYEWDFGDNLTGSKSLWKDATRDNALFLSTAVQLNSTKLQPIYDWFKNVLHISSTRGWNPDFTFNLCKDDAYKSKVLQFLKTADMDIEDLKVEEKEFDINDLPNDIPESLKNEIAPQLNGKKILNVSSIHLDSDGNEVKFSIEDDESDGTQKLLSFTGPWIDALEKGFILVVDELHDNFHPLMVKFLIDLFHNKKTNPNNAQLIFTSHETSILNQNMFRRDQVWFCEKKNKSTQLYPLSDFSPRKGVEDLEKGYFSGRYGALPFFTGVNEAMGV